MSNGFAWDTPPPDENPVGPLGKLFPALGAYEQAKSALSSPWVIFGGALLAAGIVVGIAYALAPHARTAATIAFPEALFLRRRKP